MRTTVALPPALQRRVQSLADARGASLSATLVDLTTRGLASLEDPLAIEHDPRTGFPVVSIGRSVTSSAVADLLAEE